MVKIEEVLAAVVRPAAWSWMQHRYLQSGPTCPACAERIIGARALAAWHELRRVYCASCGRSFAPTAGTPISETSWQPEEFVQLLLLADAGRTPAQIGAALGKTSACIRDMIERVRLHHIVETAPTDSQAFDTQG
jgi:transposase-like protein